MKHFILIFILTGLAYGDLTAMGRSNSSFNPGPGRSSAKSVASSTQTWKDIVNNAHPSEAEAIIKKINENQDIKAIIDDSTIGFEQKVTQVSNKIKGILSELDITVNDEAKFKEDVKSALKNLIPQFETEK